MAVRIVAGLVIAVFALFGGLPARADMILASEVGVPDQASAGASGRGIPDATAGADGVELAAEVRADGRFPAFPDPGDRAGCVACAVGLAAGAVVIGLVYVISSSSRPNTTW